MSFNEPSTKISEMLELHNQQKKNTQETLQQELNGSFKSFFDENPTVKTVHWTQYSPHFNDGEPCEFSVHDAYFTSTPHTELNDREHAWGEEDPGILEKKRWCSKTKEYVETGIDPILVENMKKLYSIIYDSSMEDVLNSAFGDGYWVKAHSGGFEVEDFDHD